MFALFITCLIIHSYLSQCSWQQFGQSLTLVYFNKLCAQQIVLENNEFRCVHRRETRSHALSFHGFERLLELAICV